MQYRTTVTCCECLDRMKKFNDRGKNGPKGYCLLYVTRKGSKIKCSRCHSKKRLEEFGYSKNNKLFANCIQCREKRREYSQKYKKQVDKPSEIDNVFNLESYYLIFSQQDNKVIIETPMNNEVKNIGSKQPEQTSENKTFSKLYRIMHS